MTSSIEWFSRIFPFYKMEPWKHSFQQSLTKKYYPVLLKLRNTWEFLKITLSFYTCTSYTYLYNIQKATVPTFYIPLSHSNDLKILSVTPYGIPTHLLLLHDVINLIWHSLHVLWKLCDLCVLGRRWIKKYILRITMEEQNIVSSKSIFEYILFWILIFI